MILISKYKLDLMRQICLILKAINSMTCKSLFLSVKYDPEYNPTYSDSLIFFKNAIESDFPI